MLKPPVTPPQALSSTSSPEETTVLDAGLYVTAHVRMLPAQPFTSLFCLTEGLPDSLGGKETKGSFQNVG